MSRFVFLIYTLRFSLKTLIVESIIGKIPVRLASYILIRI